MLIQRIKISNYKTYLSLDLDLTVDDDRPIILIGGANGGGKTTLFEAISGALYGLKIENKEHFMELLNQGALNTAKPEISLQITFVGKVTRPATEVHIKACLSVESARKAIGKRIAEYEREHVCLRYDDYSQRPGKSRTGDQ